MDKITKSLIETFSKQYEIESMSEATKFEHFSNFSIISKLFRGSFELDDIHAGSGGDCGIDGLTLIVNGRIIVDEDELRDVVETTSHLDADITFIQSKTSSSFDGSSIGSFIHGVKDFLSDEPQLVQNERIRKMKAIWESAISMSSYMINRRPICRLYYVSTGKWQNDQNLQAIINSGKSEIEGIGLFEEVSIEPFGASEIQRLFHETKNKLSSTINFQSRITLPDIEGVQEAYLGVLPFQEYIKLIQDENSTIYSIFDDNIRDFQGSNVVNKKIKNTLEEQKFDLFCVLNNGVTVVASALTPAANRFTIRDYQVVNGCQTSHVLHECQNIEGIDDVYVPIKIVVTDNDDIKTAITMATNSQTEVKTEQLEALNIFQKKLELYYNAERKSFPLHYERRSQQYNSDVGIKKTQVISIPIQIKAFASMFLNSPHLVSGYYGTIVKRFSGQIFNEEHKYSTYYVSALSYYRIEQFFRSGGLKTEHKKSRFHILYLVRLLATGEDLPPFNSNKIESVCEKFKDTLVDEGKALALLQKAQEIFESSGLDLSKKQYKSESETELLLTAYRFYNNSLQSIATASAD
ncbi:AIPR family protein [Halomonas sp. IOP_6]|uniref:AIPR family protein n=1 Tax=Halomonas sp. IOP_6 TaxID=2876583 RepID=UPI001E35523F|nr:AIPR family protein [Halomonas sp. IOP_6]MCD6006185.1 AIPR family protein [Halomonas sp. IOP_6]